MEQVRSLFQERNPDYRYGQWAGNPKGVAQDPDRCVKEVMERHIFFQCKRKRGYGPDKLYCSQHARRFANK